MFRYILEIRNRIVLLFITWLSVVFISYLYKEILLFLFMESEIFKVNEFKVYYFIFTDVLEIFSVYVRLAFFVGSQILIAYSLYYSFVFFSYSLSKLEYYYLRHLLKIFFYVYLFSVIISKYILIPTMWNFFVNFQTSGHLTLYFEAKISEYLNFYIKFYYISIFYCLFFLFTFFIFNYVNADSQLVRKFRKLYYYILIFFSTLISPPEIFSQVCISLILVFCYELFVILFLLKTFIVSTNKAAN